MSGGAAHRASGVALASALLLFAGGCQDSRFAQEALASAKTVATLRTGTMSALRNQRGSGPFRRYPLPPDEMLQVVGEAARRARGKGGQPVQAVFVSKRRHEVVAKERKPGDAARRSYEGEFLSALFAVVHADPENPGGSRVEMHETHSGPFHIGSVRWKRSMPGWIDEVLAARTAAAAGP